MLGEPTYRPFPIIADSAGYTHLHEHTEGGTQKGLGLSLSVCNVCGSVVADSVLHTKEHKTRGLFG